MEREKVYEVSKNLYDLSVREHEIESKTPNFYKIVGRNSKDAFETNYSKTFFSKEEAVNYLEFLIARQISSAQSALVNAENKLQQFKDLYK
jgi:hypothetical protein